MKHAGIEIGAGPYSTKAGVTCFLTAKKGDPIPWFVLSGIRVSDGPDEPAYEYKPPVWGRNVRIELSAYAADDDDEGCFIYYERNNG